MEYKILKTADVNKNNITKNTIHKISNKIFENPSKLQIVQYLDDTGFYLLYFDSEDQEITDTYHENLQDALNQAQWEFKLKERDWY